MPRRRGRRPARSLGGEHLLQILSGDERRYFRLLMFRPDELEDAQPLGAGKGVESKVVARDLDPESPAALTGDVDHSEVGGEMNLGVGGPAQPARRYGKRVILRGV